jgi:hypothetical protein
MDLFVRYSTIFADPDPQSSKWFCRIQAAPPSEKMDQNTTCHSGQFRLIILDLLSNTMKKYDAAATPVTYGTLRYN